MKVLSSSTAKGFLLFGFILGFILSYRQTKIIQAYYQIATQQWQVTRLNLTNNNNHDSSDFDLKLLVARTISNKELNTTLLDLNSLAKIYSTSFAKIQINWIIFIWDENIINNHSILQTLLNSNANIIRIVFEKNGKKPYFWQEHLSPEMIQTSNYDYIWLLDGDMLLSSLDWNVYWKYIFKFKPMISQPATLNPQFLYTRYQVLNTYIVPGWPMLRWANYNSTGVPIIGALEVGVIEIQCPLFTAEAWNLYYSFIVTNIKYTKENLIYFGDETQNQTILSNYQHCGPDYLWCGVMRQRKEGNDWRANARKAFIYVNPLFYPFNNQTEILKENNQTVFKVNSTKLNNNNQTSYCLSIHATRIMHMDNHGINKDRQWKQETVTTDKFYKRNLASKYFPPNKAQRRIYAAYLDYNPV